MFKSIILASAAALLVGTAPSFAEETASISTAESSSLSNEHFNAPRRFELLAGLSAGYSSLSDPTLSGMNGSQLGLMLVGSLYRDSFVFDLGLGWGRNSMSGTFLGTTPATVTTQTGVAELSPRYRMGERFQLGPVAQFEYGARSDFSVTTGTSGNLVTVLGGLKAVYEIPMMDRHLRIVGRAMTDLNVANNNLFLLLAGAEIPLYGVKLGGSEGPRDIITVAQSAPEVTVNLPMKLVHFDSNSAKLDEKSLSFVRNLGRLLAENNVNWSSVSVTGHTDQWGELDYNQSLSERRAHAVSRALMQGGVDSGRLTEAGFGKTRPLNEGRTKQAMAQNRRVELGFTGVSNPARLLEVLKSLE